MASESTKSTAMNGGDGLYSYTQNSSFQRNGVESARILIAEAVAEKLDIKQISSSSSSKVFTIADLGCSVGPNTFIAVQNIIEAVKLKCQTQCPDQEIPEFQVFFNDHSSNDFNTLFVSLPFDKQYYAAGVPGLFQGRLFPKSSLHFVHSSYALQWLSNVPKEVVDKNSPSWNKGRISYNNAPKEVIEAYSAQFAKDFELFLSARAKEIVIGGLMAFLLPCLPDGVATSQCYVFAAIDILGDCLLDTAEMGLVSEAKVDSFNMPRYNPTAKKLEELIKENGCFSIEQMEPLVRSATVDLSSNVAVLSKHMRAAWEGVVRGHFGDDLMDEVFDRFTKNLVESSVFSPSSNYKHIAELFVLLKRNDMA